MPCASPVIGTWTLVAFAGNAMEAGTVAEAVLSELRAMVTPAGAGAERFSVRFVVPPPVPTVITFEAKLSEALDHYQREGVREDLDNCSNSDDLNELRNSLSELTQQYGLDFARMVSSIDQAIAERNELEPEYDGGGSSGNQAGERTEVITEDEVRDMFSTLRG